MSTAPKAAPRPTVQLAVSGGDPVSKQPVPFMSTALEQGEIDAAVAVLKSGMLRQASKCAEMEARLAKMSDAKHALTCANGTCALQLAYEVVCEPGDEVLVPAWTYIATAAMIVARGAVPVFVDVNEDTFQIDVEDAAKKVTKKTKAIACTHLYGGPVDIAGVEALANRHGLRVVYDAAQAHLARYKGKGIGAFGDVVTYSFYATKNLATGEGGMVTTNDDDLARSMSLLRSHGETDKYLHERIGYNYRMNDVTAAIGCSRLDKIERWTRQRQAVADKYTAILDGIEGVLAPAVTEGGECVWHLYTCRLDLGKFTCTRDEFCAALKAEGVPTAVHYPRSVTRQPAFKNFVKGHPPVSDSLSARVFCLPMHQDLTPEHVGVVERALKKVAGAFAR